MWKPTLRGGIPIHAAVLHASTRPPKEGPTLPLSDDVYTKSICPSGGHGRGWGIASRYKTGVRLECIR